MLKLYGDLLRFLEVKVEVEWRGIERRWRKEVCEEIGGWAGGKEGKREGGKEGRRLKEESEVCVYMKEGKNRCICIEMRSKGRIEIILEEIVRLFGECVVLLIFCLFVFYFPLFLLLSIFYFFKIYE